MAGLDIQREDLDGVVTLKLEGTFDGSAAQRLRQSLMTCDGRPVVIDFSRVRHMVDAAVGVLSRGLSAASVELKGLGSHQERVFRYLGVQTGATRRAPYYPVDDLLAP